MAAWEDACAENQTVDISLLSQWCRAMCVPLPPALHPRVAAPVLRVSPMSTKRLPAWGSHTPKPGAEPTPHPLPAPLPGLSPIKCPLLSILEKHHLSDIREANSYPGVLGEHV